MDRRRLRPWLCGVAFLMGACLICGPARADQANDQVLFKKALELKGKRQYRDACPIFELLSARIPEAREEHLQCLRHILQDRRHRERAFRDTVIGLKKSGQVLDVYVRVLHILQAHYVDPERTEAGRLFQQGLLEMRYALEDDAFLKEYLTTTSAESVAAFRSFLRDWDVKAVRDNNAAREQVRKVAKAAHDALKLPLPVVAFEFICGACNSLDEYTAYLTPAQVREVQALLRGKFSGIGVEPAVLDQKIVIGQIHPQSQAARAFKVGDRIIRIDRKPVDAASPAEVRAKLRGQAGTTVEVEVIREGESKPRTVKLERKPYVMPSVEIEPEPRDGVGYARVLSFTDTTVQELKDAIGRLQAAGMQALVLDLRGNPGGLFKSSIQVAEMFLSEGLIVHTQSRLKEFNDSHRANNPDAFTFPLVLLIDGETASSAEVLAGAMKDNDRARLVGQPTYGKGTIQWVVPLEIVSAGVKITVARFLSPSGEPYNGRGVTPDIIVQVSADAKQNAAAVRAVATRIALQQIMMMPR